MRKKYCWLAENKWLKAQANRLSVAEERGEACPGDRV
jgi:hypothetical protein